MLLKVGTYGSIMDRAQPYCALCGGEAFADDPVIYNDEMIPIEWICKDCALDVIALAPELERYLR